MGRGVKGVYALCNLCMHLFLSLCVNVCNYHAAGGGGGAPPPPFGSNRLSSPLVGNALPGTQNVTCSISARWLARRRRYIQTTSTTSDVESTPSLYDTR